MKRIPMVFLCLTMLLAGGLSQAVAQIPDASKAEIEKLHRFVGEWVAKDAGFESTSGKADFEMKLEAVPILSERALQFHLTADIAEVGEYEERDFLVYDAMEEKVALMAVSSFGEAAMYTGHWEGEEQNVLQLSARKSFQGKQLDVQVTITFTDDDEFTWTVVNTLDGKEVGRFWATFEED